MSMIYNDVSDDRPLHKAAARAIECARETGNHGRAEMLLTEYTAVFPKEGAALARELTQ